MRAFMFAVVFMLATVFVGVPVADAHNDAPCWSPKHGDVYYTSHGTTHLRDYYFHAYTTDTYRVYHQYPKATWPYYVRYYQGNDQCFWGPFHF